MTGSRRSIDFACCAVLDPNPETSTLELVIKIYLKNENARSSAHLEISRVWNTITLDAI